MRRLYETKRLLPLCAEVVVIAAKPEKQLAWLMARNDLSDQQVCEFQSCMVSKLRASHAIASAGTFFTF